MPNPTDRPPEAAAVNPPLAEEITRLCNERTELLTTARGLVASFDPTSGPDRTRAFLADLTRLFTPGSAEHEVAVALSGSDAPTGATVSKWAKAGWVASIRTPGGQHRFSRAEIEARLRGER